MAWEGSGDRVTEKQKRQKAYCSLPDTFNGQRSAVSNQRSAFGLQNSSFLSLKTSCLCNIFMIAAPIATPAIFDKRSNTLNALSGIHN